MLDIVTNLPRIVSMSQRAIDKVSRLAALHELQPQVPLETRHALHAGLYCRTLLVPADVEITGALIKIPTIVIVSGDVDVFLGEETVRITGYCVLPAAAHRKQAFRAYTDTLITMVFPSSAKTVEEAECEFTDEAETLASRREGAHAETIITGA